MTRVAHAPSSYDMPARVLHWLTAGVIVLLFALGLAASNWPMDTGEAFAVKSALFSAHKTLGITALVLAVMRILWALSSTHPAPLASHGAVIRGLSGIVHWSLYVALLAVPLTGWLHHATSTGFAPIWWPFGQTLPLLPQDAPLSAAFGAMHWLATKLLAALVLAHVGGALLHHWRDRDVTLLRMTRGSVPAAATVAPGARALRALPALGIWALALGIALALPRGVPVAETVLGAGRGDWVVEQGEIAFTVTQTRQPVRGRFTRWSADIAFDPQPVAGRHGNVRVEIDITSLGLGAVTVEALAPEFFDANNHPVAVFDAEIVSGEDGAYLARGTLSLKGTERAVELPFTLVLEGERARMEGRVTLDRRDFVIGPNYADEATVGFPVSVEVALEATRRPPD